MCSVRRTRRAERAVTGALRALGLLVLVAGGCNCAGWSALGAGEEPEQEGVAVPDALEGRWKASGSLGEHQDWFKDITLEDGRYALEGYPPISERARISAVDKTGPRTWKLTLTDRVFEGEDEDDEVLEIVLAEDGASFELNGETYRRTPAR